MRSVTLRNSGMSVGVGKILCLGRNYADHAKEMKSDIPEFPIVFLKPSTAILWDKGTLCVPHFSHEVHHEVEMVVMIGKKGRNIPREQALGYVGGYGVGLDMTLRDVQAEAKRKGLPWTVAKGFDTSAPVSTIVEAEYVPHPENLDLSLHVNGSLRQKSNTSAMIFPIEYVVSYLSSIFTLERGDLIYTGTPEGVAAVVPGDTMEARLGSIASLHIHVEGIRPAGQGYPGT